MMAVMTSCPSPSSETHCLSRAYQFDDETGRSNPSAAEGCMAGLEPNMMRCVPKASMMGETIAKP